MRRLVFLVVVALGAAVAGCQGASTCDLTGTGRAFGACCTEDAECLDGVCHEFGDGTESCTKACTADANCPAGSQGQKCNAQGVCRP